MKFIQTLTDWWEARQKKREEKRKEQLEILSCEEINIREFNGKIYLSYNGVPIVASDSLNAEVVDIVKVSRKTYLQWKAKFDK